VVRTGYHPNQAIQTGIANIPIAKPKVNDRRLDEDCERPRLQTQIIPPYLKKTRSIEKLLPWRYLHGISTGGY